MGNIWARVFKTRDVRILICGEYISVDLFKYIKFIMGMMIHYDIIFDVILCVKKNTPKIKAFFFLK